MYVYLYVYVYMYMYIYIHSLPSGQNCVRHPASHLLLEPVAQVAVAADVATGVSPRDVKGRGKPCPSQL